MAADEGTNGCADGTNGPSRLRFAQGVHQKAQCREEKAGEKLPATKSGTTSVQDGQRAFTCLHQSWWLAPFLFKRKVQPRLR